MLFGVWRAACAVIICLFGLMTLSALISQTASAKTTDAEWQRLLKAEELRHEERWAFLRDAYFNDREIGEATGVIELTAPIVPIDPAIVPVSIKALIPQTADRFIQKITLLVDHNPSPLAAVFHLSERNGVADLATRVRVGEFSHVRAVAEMNDGSLLVASKFVKASGGCDVVPFEDKAAVNSRLGKMKLRLPGGVAVSGASEKVGARFADLLIEHPNYNGMQASEIPGVMIPMRTLDHVEVTYDQKPLLRIEGYLSLSHNPKFRFHYIPEEDRGVGPGSGFSVRLLDSAKAEFERSWPSV